MILFTQPTAIKSKSAIRLTAYQDKSFVPTHLRSAEGRIELDKAKLDKHLARQELRIFPHAHYCDLVCDLVLIVTRMNLNMRLGYSFLQLDNKSVIAHHRADLRYRSEDDAQNEDLFNYFLVFSIPLATISSKARDGILVSHGHRHKKISGMFDLFFARFINLLLLSLA